MEFPSRDHLESLRRKRQPDPKKDGNELDVFTGVERMQYHAYDYAFRRDVLFRTDDISPIDPGQKHFDEFLVSAAQQMHRDERRRLADERAARQDAGSCYREKRRGEAENAAWRAAGMPILPSGMTVAVWRAMGSPDEVDGYDVWRLRPPGWGSPPRKGPMRAIAESLGVRAVEVPQASAETMGRDP